MKKTVVSFQIWLLVLAFAAPLIAQQTTPDTLITNELQPVTVTAFRLETSDLATPLSVTTIGKNQLQNGTQQLALDEALMGVPGVFVQNGANFAQDIRLSIRGFGARSAFGIRGVKILVDGFPESAPDGTSQVDAIDPTALTGISIIRSGTSGLYGNASGGYVNFSSLSFVEKPQGQVRFMAGQYGALGGSAKYSAKAGKTYYSLNSNYMQSEGYRDFSAMQSFLLNGGVLIPLDSSLTLKLVATYVNSPKAQDPGGLNEMEVEADRSQANPSNKAGNFGEELWQARLGLTIKKTFKKNNTLTGSIFQTGRSFNSRVPKDLIELERSFTGGSLGYGFKKKAKWLSYECSIGLNLELQNDQRKRYETNGPIQGPLYQYQLESFSNIGTYLVQAFGLGSKFILLPSVRFDRVQLQVKDKFLTDNLDNSFSRNYNVINPTIGISYLPTRYLNLYANGSRNFETPTLLEIDQSYNGLEPQTSKTLELGVKWLAKNGKWRTELAVYRIWLENEFVPVYSDFAPSHFGNAGKSKRKGIELALTHIFSKYLDLNISANLGEFKYVDYMTGDWVLTDYSGNNTAGIPQRTAAFSFNYSPPSGFYGSFGGQYIGDFYIDDLNTKKTSAYFISFLRLGGMYEEGKIKIGPFVGINNLFNAKYNANIRTNATRPFEPAAPVNFYGGFKMNF